jgi:hypothetical protein
VALRDNDFEICFEGWFLTLFLAKYNRLLLKINASEMLAEIPKSTNCFVVLVEKF